MLTPAPSRKRKQQILTREQFEQFLLGVRAERGGTGPVRILVPAPYDIVPCDCGDVICHGWRVVERGRPADRIIDHSPTELQGIT